MPHERDARKIAPASNVIGLPLAFENDQGVANRDATDDNQYTKHLNLLADVIAQRGNPKIVHLKTFGQPSRIAR